MFGRGRAVSGGASAGPGFGRGPVSIPRRERLELKRIGPTDAAENGTSSPVALAPTPPEEATVPSFSARATNYQQQSASSSPATAETTMTRSKDGQSDATKKNPPTTADAVRNPTARQPDSRKPAAQNPNPMSGRRSLPLGGKNHAIRSNSREGTGASSSSGPVRAGATKADAQAAVRQSRVVKQSAMNLCGDLLRQEEGKKDESSLTYGQSLEYATGVMLGKHVLEKVLRDYDYLEEDILIEAPRLLSTYARGKLIFIQGPDGTPFPSWITRVSNQDALRLGEWTEGDRCLSYVNEEYIDWWKRRVQLFDPGCEMVKISTRQGELLGVVYLERNIVDDTDPYRSQLGTPRRGTLIRGIRVNPKYNHEACRRARLSVNVDEDDEEEMQYRGLSHALFIHALFLSLSYGTSAVFVNAPKNEVAELFYEGYMGPAKFIDAKTGRKQYQMDSAMRWNVLAAAFRRQLDMLVKFKEFETEKERKKIEYKAHLALTAASKKNKKKSNGGWFFPPYKQRNKNDSNESSKGEASEKGNATQSSKREASNATHNGEHKEDNGANWTAYRANQMIRTKGARVAENDYGKDAEPDDDDFDEEDEYAEPEEDSKPDDDDDFDEEEDEELVEEEEEEDQFEQEDADADDAAKTYVDERPTKKERSKNLAAELRSKSKPRNGTVAAGPQPQETTSMPDVALSTAGRTTGLKGRWQTRIIKNEVDNGENGDAKRVKLEHNGE